jgi:hypothetical protein
MRALAARGDTFMPDIHADEPQERKPDQLVFGDGERSADRSRAAAVDEVPW